MTGKRYSKQREAILNLLKSVECHPDAQWIYETLKTEIPALSLGTVYRNLSMLESDGEIIRIDTDSGRVNYDGRLKPHEHFVCKQCRTIYDINLSSNVNEQLLSECGMKADTHSLVFYGVCPMCQNKN